MWGCRICTSALAPPILRELNSGSPMNPNLTNEGEFMIQTIQLTPGVVLRHCPDSRFKKGALSIQLLRPMCEEETALNALLPAVALRGTREHPDLRAITEALDDLYGASIGALVRRIGDVQTVGFYLSFMEDRFALEGDEILAPMIAFLEETMLRPKLEDGLLDRDFVESEKKNLISTIESELNDKRSYAGARMLRQMCRGDSFSVPRLGRAEAVAEITPQGLTDHYHHILRRSPVEIFYVGSADGQRVARLLMPLARALAREPEELPAQSVFAPSAEPSAFSEEMDISQSKLSMGFYSGISNQSREFAAMQVFNAVYGGGMTSKLFVHVREELSLCYYANSAYYGSKGIVTVSCGIDEAQYGRAREEILGQLEACRRGEITREELEGAKMAILSSLRAVPDSPGALEGFYGTAAVSGMNWDIPEYMDRIRAVTAEDVASVARRLQLHTEFLLRGVGK